MSEQWDGRPENPEQDGLHYISDAVAMWDARKQKWALLSRTRAEPAEWLAKQWWAEYRGPCPTIEEFNKLTDSVDDNLTESEK